MKKTTNNHKIPDLIHTEVNLLAYLLFITTGSLMISTKEASVFTTRSEISLERDRAEGIGIPYTKLGKGNGSDRVLYNVYDVSKYIVSRKVKVM